MNTKYNEYVEKAKVLLKQIECYQAKIAAMAVELCDIRHGGRSEGIYTLGKFADDIGMERKTLSNWVGVYREVVIKCDLKSPSPEQWKNASKVEKLLRNTRAVDNKLSGEVRSRAAYRKGVSRETVKELFNEVSKDKDNTLFKINRCLSSAKHIKSTLSSADLNKVHKKYLTEIMENLDEASDTINDFLTNKRKKP